MLLLLHPHHVHFYYLFSVSLWRMAEGNNEDQLLAPESLDGDDIKNLIRAITARQQILLENLVTCDEMLIHFSRLKTVITENEAMQEEYRSDENSGSILERKVDEEPQQCKNENEELPTVAISEGITKIH
ncbi:hypothetical protein NDU88_001598 [Pleurodeles waltl]|uniref:Uncharacterized protein n=1 Tax=Pleurodeles waltl TaxID=8319 RepID=A0AAV7TJ63_PLEWA|nr:hypothetical protein NDU88_001598 [Pleurodeles waltl]